METNNENLYKNRSNDQLPFMTTCRAGDYVPTFIPIKSAIPLWKPYLKIISFALL